ncbi:hypothetical protein BTM25_33850 [Actinomadura rubteroloni]|uniref:Putative restriction endonuclease domain-containing protein n=1 Tax=Actinomadura rubteroloni TaxID=1926885 RepID=A0A2P4UI76_9ACTN|nr:hypothetical protein BTM25_33850 [Actinomadura rubteroloni]
MTKVKIQEYEATLPDSLHKLWVSGELHDILHLPDEGPRVEIIGGEIVVSPAAALRHNFIVGRIAETLRRAKDHRDEFPWTTDQNTGLTIGEALEEYIPDLVVLDEEVLDTANETGENILTPDQIELVVEVTSQRNAKNDRPRPSGSRTKSKWVSYARAGIPYYLLIDRDPKIARTILYSVPDGGVGAYLHSEEWEFGKTIHLPEPFDIDIDTSKWTTW